MLRSAPSLSVFVSTDDEAGHHRPEEDSEAGEALRRTTAKIADGIPAVGSGEFSFGRKTMGLSEEEGDGEGDAGGGTVELGFRNESSAGDDVEREPASPPMYLAAGLGIGNADFGGGSNGGLVLNPPEFDGVGDAEEYYERMVNEFPCHPVFLRTYAQVLQSKGDLHGAEDYSYRATLANPEDGEILAQYAKIVWDLYQDKERALTYYERAAQAAANNSHVLAAYAGFLWELEDENETDGVQENHLQGKQDLERAEEYYSRAILADPMDGEALVMSAELVWQLHRDHDKATSYFERAIQATPTESHILAAYASFLWETENDDEDESDSAPGAVSLREAIGSASA